MRRNYVALDMPFSLNNIPESHVPLLKRLYEGKYQELRTKLDPLLKEMAEMEPILFQLGIITPKNAELSIDEGDDLLGPYIPSILPDGYNPSWRWLQKIEFILNHSGKPMTSSELIEDIMRREPNEQPTRLANSIPATLSTAARDRKIERKMNERNEYEYWINENPF